MMAEFQHHYEWLAPVREHMDATQRGGLIDPALLEEGRRLCLRVLEQNSQSLLAHRTLERIQALMGTAAPNVEVGDLSEAEAQLQERIEAFEDSFLQYGQDVMLPLIEDIPPEKEGLKRALRYPFEAFEENRNNNPLRNSEAARRLAAAKNMNWQHYLLLNQKEGHFAFDQFSRKNTPKYDDITAGYAPMARTMAFHPKMNTDNELHQFVIMHECFHIPQMTLRLRTAPKLYAWLYADPRGIHRAVVNDECQAYGLQIEALNLRLGGKLKHEAMDGRIVPHEELMQELGAEGEQWMMLNMLGRYARDYYMEECDAARGKFGQRFKAENIRSCLHDGYETYVIGGDKRLHRVFPQQQ